MEIKPQNFFVGVVDFFSVWLPGAMLAWFLVIFFYNPGMEEMLRIPDNNAVKVIFFLLVTYIIGNILFGFSYLLDGIYDRKLRKRFKQKDKDHFELELKTATAIKNTFINADEWITKHQQSGELSAEQVKKLYSKEYRYIINTYKWSLHYLLYKSPEALADVKRLEADSKFFRSLVITFLFISVTLAIKSFPDGVILQTRLIIAGVFLLLALLSLYLFSTFRYKATIRAYELIITHYYLQSPPESAVTKTVSSSIIKSDILPVSAEEHKKTFDSLLRGFSGHPKQVTVKKGELQNVFFGAEKNEWWYCIKGKGTMILKEADKETTCYLQPGSLLTVQKRGQYSFSNMLDEPMELLVVS